MTLAHLMENAEERGRKAGLQAGLQAGRKEGEARVKELYLILNEQNRLEDMNRAMTDEEYLAKLFVEFNL